MAEPAERQIDTSWVFSNFQLLEANLNGGKRSPFHAIRKGAFERFAEVGFPTPRDEEWKYTDTAPIARTGFRLPAGSAGAAARPSALSEISSIQVTLVDGAFAPDLSSLSNLPEGLSVRPLKRLLDAEEDGAARAVVDRHLAKYASWKDQPFVALNTAFVRDGVVITAARNAVIKEPIVINVVSGAQEQSFSSPRILVVAEESSQVSVVEHYSAGGAASYLTNAVTEIVAAENAQVEHVKFQRESESAYHMGSVNVHLSRASNVKTFTFSFGGKLVRNEINPIFTGEGANCLMNGLTVLRDEQHVDNYTVLDHAKPRCESTEMFKGIYADRSSGAFNGTIIVRQDAQKTNAIQSNQSILLSDQASINSKPQLKIWADDVKCTHGATVGQLDEISMFYLRSRGISQHDARNMLVHAFASDVISGISHPGLKEALEAELSAKLHSIEA